jgi:hypothetical protein
VDNTDYRATWASGYHVLLPIAAGRVKRGVWVHGACQVAAVAAHTFTGALASLHIKLVPGRGVDWSPPTELGQLEAITKKLVAHRGTPRWWVVQVPSDHRRRRFNLLVLDEDRRPLSFIKLTTNPLNELAVRAQSTFSEQPPTLFWAPSLLSSGRLEGWSYTALTPMPNLPHWPARIAPATRQTIVEEFQQLLGRSIDSVPLHGDFGPWNVRRMSNSVLAVVDWEEMTLGPPAADEVWHSVCRWADRRSATSIQRVLAELPHYSSDHIVTAARFWVDRLGRPEAEEIDKQLAMPERLALSSSRRAALLHRLAAANW